MDENTIVLWDQDGVETTFEKIFSIEIEGENYIILSPVQSKYCEGKNDYDEGNHEENNINEDYEENDDEVLVFKIKDSDHGELLVHLKEDECTVLIEKCKSLFEKFISSNNI